MLQFFLCSSGSSSAPKILKFFNERSLGKNLGLVDPCFQKTFLKSTETSEELFQIFKAFLPIEIR